MPEQPNRKLKILYHHRVAAQDGQSVHIRELVSAFERQGHEIIFVGPSIRPSALGEENRALKFIRKALPKFAQELLELLYGVRAYFKLKAAVKQHQPDFLYERYNLFLPAGSWLKKKTGIPYFVEVNAPLSDERAEYSGLALKGLAKRFERETFRNADRLFPVSQVLADIICQMGASPERITVLHNGIIPSEYASADGTALRDSLGMQGKVVLGFVGFIREWHRLDRVIKVLSHHGTNPDLHLLVVGDGPAVADCKELANKIGVAHRTHFVGFQDRSAIPDHLASMDIALQPAVTDYASPLKMFEYLISGLATIAPDQPNIREILSHEDTGILFAPDNFDEAEEAIVRLSQDENLRMRIGLAGKDLIRSRKFTWDNNALEICALAEQQSDS